jgi:hypothetical protein
MIRLNILVKVIHGLPMYFVIGNSIIISRAYQTPEAAVSFLDRKLKDFGPSAVDQYRKI